MPTSPSVRQDQSKLLQMWNNMQVHISRYDSVVDITIDDGTDADGCDSNYWESASMWTRGQIRDAFGKLLLKYIPSVMRKQDGEDEQKTKEEAQEAYTARTDPFKSTSEYISSVRPKEYTHFTKIHQEIRTRRNKVMSQIPENTQLKHLVPDKLLLLPNGMVRPLKSKYDNLAYDMNQFGAIATRPTANDCQRVLLQLCLLKLGIFKDMMDSLRNHLGCFVLIDTSYFMEQISPLLDEIMMIAVAVYQSLNKYDGWNLSDAPPTAGLKEQAKALDMNFEKVLALVVSPHRPHFQ